MRFGVVLFLLSFAPQLRAQPLNGVWKGTLTQREGGCFPVYYLEIQLQEDGVQLMGVSYDYYDTTKYVKHRFTGRYNALTKRMVLEETKMLAVRIPPHCVPCIKSYDLVYSKEDGLEVLSGSWKGVDAEKGAPCPPGEIRLLRNPQPVFPVERLAPDTPSNTLTDRITDLVSTIDVHAPEMEILLYDNAEIDGDTVSLHVNNRAIAQKVRLAAQPLRYELKLEPGVVYDLVMRAENLGEIPPNTALMVIRSGEERFEVRMSSTLEKSAMVRFRFIQR
ncbi:hypothetical protein [Parasegetibacter sp. NRK P23]|uniref:hypothetical protein n=1 Tax=Parasegetibacter sp. NRK P23 TaxID=2942999 RepID=UPI0020434A02|nr:hypothetical protein [Parasegetibacter sp. NRK P23]MCM5528582.1 hypothetical protein [Parasegetibacter sp. NRK P23]